MRTPTDAAALRRCALAVTVLFDLDLEPGDEGLALTPHDPDGTPALLLPWDEVGRAVDGVDPDSPSARLRLATWVRDRATLASWGPEESRTRVRPVALPPGHALHPGADWVRTRVPGGALETGLGLQGLRGDDERVDACLPSVLAEAGLDLDDCWPAATAHLEEEGAGAAARLARGDTVLRPVGGCDVLTLLGSASLRAALCAGERHTLRAVCAPVRHRGWLDARRVDPAFVAAAAMAADPPDRGFTRPVLVTHEEVVLARDGGHAVADLLADPAPSDAWWARPVRYR